MELCFLCPDLESDLVDRENVFSRAFLLLGCEYCWHSQPVVPKIQNPAWPFTVSSGIANSHRSPRQKARDLARVRKYRAAHVFHSHSEKSSCDPKPPHEQPQPPGNTSVPLLPPAKSGDAYCTYLKQWVVSSTCSTAAFIRDCLANASTKTKRQSLFPLPLFSRDALKDQCAIDFVTNCCIVGLNLLNADMSMSSKAYPAHGTPSVAQQRSHELIRTRCARFLERLDAIDDLQFEAPSPEVALRAWLDVPDTSFKHFDGNSVNLPLRSAAVDPQAHLSPGTRRIVSNADLLFSGADWKSLPPALRIGISVPNYAKLTARMLQNGKLGLMRGPLGKASIFAVGKKGSTKLREVWAGQHISGLAARPPKPPMLGNPGVFARIVKPPHLNLFLSKRDATAFFDQLALPRPLVPCFGRPTITVQALIDEGGLSLESLSPLVLDLGTAPLKAHEKLVPVSLVWPMGFSWSSFIAQSTLVAVSRGAGIPDAQIISLDQPHPKDQSELVALATDDAIFVHTDKAAALQRLNDFDDSLLHYHVERNKAKDENARDHIIALGCSVGNKPAWVEPDCEKLLKLLLTFLGLTSNTSIRPRSLEGMLGIAQWFAQVPRWTFSVFNHIYDVQKSACADDPCTFNELCIAELHVYTSLAPLMVADLERQFLPFIACCDASPSFGFGVSFFRSTGKHLVEGCLVLSPMRSKARGSDLEWPRA